MDWKRAACIFILSGVLVGCNLPTPSKLPKATAASGGPTPAITVIPQQQATTAAGAAAAPTSSPSTTSTAGPLPTQGPASAIPTQSGSFKSFKATVLVDGARLRAGPGTLFLALNWLPKGTGLDVWGRSRGNEWIYVQTADGAHGWVFTQLLQVEVGADIRTAPEVTPGDALIVHGRVVDASGAAVDGIQFALTQGSGSSAPRTDAVTDANGDFYAFFPSTASGTWTVSYAAIAGTSRKSGASGSVQPQTAQISLPQNQVITFTWK